MADFDFKKELLDYFPKNIRKDVDANEDEISLPNLVYLISTSNVVVSNALKDLKTYLKKAMGISAEITNEEVGFSVKAVLAPLKTRSFEIEVTSNGITVKGDTYKSCQQGIFHLELLMTAKRAPILKKGVIKYDLPFSPRMVHSGYAMDDFPDAYLSNIAHHGYDAIIVYSNGADSSRSANNHTDFNDLVKRAEKYGIDVYAFAYFNNFVDVTAPDCEEKMDSTYGLVFKSCPGFKGIILVGESVEFDSKDPRVAHHPVEVEPEDNIPVGVPTPGWFPCSDYPQWIEALKKSVRKFKPDADIIFWTYNWGYCPKDVRIELIKNMPTDVTLEVTFEMFQHYEIEGIEEGVSDYSLTRTDAGEYFLSEAEIAKERGIKLYAMTNTCGRTWDYGTAPYVPAPYAWIKRCDAINDARKKYGLSGLMESHHMGLFPSFISRLNQLCFMSEDYEANLNLALDEAFGCHSDALKDALNDWSEAIKFMPPTVEEQYGPFRNGPAYPFCLIKPLQPPKLEGAANGINIWAPTYAEFGNYINFGISDESWPYSLRHNAELKMLEKMVVLYTSGIKKMKALKNSELNRLINLGEYLVCCIKTTINVKKFTNLKFYLRHAETKAKMANLCKKIRAISEQEIANCQKAIKHLKKDSTLGFEPSMLYVGGVDMVNWKLKQMNYMLNVELDYFERYSK